MGWREERRERRGKEERVRKGRTWLRVSGMEERVGGEAGVKMRVFEMEEKARGRRVVSEIEEVLR